MVITQNDKGDKLFVVESGTLICTKKLYDRDGDEIEELFLKTYESGEVFGELALLYNAPRAASIKATSDCILYALDRCTFNSIVRESSIKRKERYDTFLKSVPLLSSLDYYKLSQLADVIKEEVFEANDVIIKQGDKGDVFYILMEGEAIAI